MVKTVGSRRKKTRSKLSKSPRQRGKVALRRFVAKLNVGDRVVLNAEPSVQRGMYFPRFHGLSGTIVSERGNAYFVSIKDKGKRKKLLVSKIHLKKV